MINNLRFLCTALILIAFGTISAQRGSVDTSYYQGMGIERGNTCLVLPDGSVLVGGNYRFSNHDKWGLGCLTKLRPDGTNDPTFSVGSGANAVVNCLALQPDGKILVGGNFNIFNGAMAVNLVRLNADGSVDNTFVTGAGFAGINATTVSDIHLKPDGKILVGGLFTSYDGTPCNNMCQLLDNGAFDGAFNLGSGCDNQVFQFDLQSNGMIIVGGAFLNYNGQSAPGITRLFTDGTKDATFNPGAGVYNLITNNNPGIVLSLYVLANGKIVIGGAFQLFNGDTVNNISILLNNGQRDVTFNPGITLGITNAGFNAGVNEMAIQPDGKILVTGGFTKYKGVNVRGNQFVMRLDTAGNADPGFNTNKDLTSSRGIDAQGNALHLNPDGKIYVGGRFGAMDSFGRVRFARLLPNGNVDQSFYHNAKLNRPNIFQNPPSVYALGEQSNGQVILGGQFTHYNERMVNRIVRLTANGDVDVAFNPGGSGADSTIRAIKVLTNNQILIGGDFTHYNGVAINRIARLNADGTLDNTFQPGTGANNTVLDITADASGGIYLAGNFTQFYAASPAVSFFVKLNASGTINSTYNTGGAGFNGPVIKLYMQTDGMLLAGGNFTTYNGAANGRIIRLTTSGTADATFVTGTGASGNVSAIDIDANGRIIIGGGFTQYNSVNAARIARLSSLGVLDATFGASIGGQVNDVLALNDGVLAVGLFGIANSVVSNNIVFTDLTGATNTSRFYYTTGLDQQASKLLYDAKARRVYMGGAFINVNGQNGTYFASLKNSNIDLTHIYENLCPGAITKLYYNLGAAFNTGNVLMVQISDASGNFTSSSSIGQRSSTIAGSDSVILLFPNTMATSCNYRVRIISTNPADTSNVSGTICIAPTPSATITTSGPLTFCKGDSVILTAPDGGDSYFWITPHSDTTQSYTATNSGNYSVFVTSNNCNAQSQVIHVVAYPLPDSTISVSAASLCGNGELILTAAPNLTYVWSNAITTMADTITQSATYSLTVTDAHNCKAQSTSIINVATYLSNIIVPSGPTTLCQGDSVTLSAIGNLTYNWSTTATTQNIVVKGAGDYKVTVSDGTCSDTSSVVHVTVNALPTVALNLPVDTNVCSTSSIIQLSGGSPAGGTFSGSGVNGTAFNPASFAGSNVAITYSYTDNNSCINTAHDTIRVRLCTGIDELTNSTWSVFPNPANSNLFISSSVANIKDVQVVDLLGHTVIEQHSLDGRSNAMIDISHIAAGTYIIKAGEKKFMFVKTTE